MDRRLIIRRLAIAAVGVGMLVGTALGMADGPALPAGPSTLASSPAHDDLPARSEPGEKARITDFSEYQLAPPASGEEAGPYRVTK